MRKATTNPARPEPRASVKLVRCAVYTRKSTEEGLEQEFNSLDAQRESGEAFVRSQTGEGWTVNPDRYDDGGFTGGNTDRPALQRLMADIGAGKVDCVVVYKVDRLSRSLLDFAQMMQTFEKQKVSFVSVTQQFNTGTSMGRLVLNVLLSFAQFEREIISERTRDKIAATRRKGKWTGGHPILGYDVDPNGFKLAVNSHEAERVRAIFALYLEHGSLLPVVEELERRGWPNKRWTTRKGPERGGKAFTRTNLYNLLTNVAYIGKVRYKDEVHDGEHPAIVDPGIFQKTQETLRRNGRTGGAPVRNQFGAILKGLLKCTPCNCSMSPAHTTKGNRRYRYYVCCSAQKRGRATCPSKSVPAGPIEEFVVDRIRCVGRDPALLRQVLAQARSKDEAHTAALEAEERGLTQSLKSWHTDVRRLSSQLKPGDDNGVLLGRLAELHERIGHAENRVKRVRDDAKAAAAQSVGEEEATRALTAFDPVWGTLTPHEQARVIEASMNAASDPTGLTISGSIHFDRGGKGSRKQLRSGPAPVAPSPGRVPRVARLMALALRFERLVQEGIVADFSELAALSHVTRARVSQIMSLVHLAPDIQEALLFLPRTERGRDSIVLRDLLPIAGVADWGKQYKMWSRLSG